MISRTRAYPIGFSYHNGQPMGIMYDALRALEAYVNEKLKMRAMKVQVTFIPVRPNQVEAALTQGLGDLVAYALVVTPERSATPVIHGSHRNGCKAGGCHRTKFPPGLQPEIE